MVEVAQYVVKYNLAGPVPGRSYRGLKHPHLEDLGWRTSLSCSPGDTASSHILPPPALKCEWCRICPAGTHSHVEQKIDVVGGTGRNLEMNLFMEFLNRAYTVSSKTSRGQPTETTIQRHSRMLMMGPIDHIFGQHRTTRLCTVNQNVPMRWLRSPNMWLSTTWPALYQDANIVDSSTCAWRTGRHH